MNAEEFKKAVIKYLETHDAQELAEEFDCATPTILRWASGDACPVPSLRKYIAHFMEAE